MSDAIASFAHNCLVNIKANERVIARNVQSTLMLATALVPKIGYDKATELAKKAFREDCSLKESALSLGYLTADQFDAWVKPQDMVAPMKRKVTACGHSARPANLPSAL